MQIDNLARIEPQGTMTKDDIENFFKTRAPERIQFLKQHGWHNSNVDLITEDCAFRRYFRVRQDNKTAVLMDGVPDHQGAAAPGHRIDDFLKISEYLSQVDIAVPDIYAVDQERGLVLMQDFGDMSFQQAIEQGHDQEKLYGLAVDLLKRLSNALETNSLNLAEYGTGHVHKGRRRIVEWYMPVVLKRFNPDGIVEEYLQIWDSIESSLPPCPKGFVHVDYHVENLMWRPHQEGIKQCGILDFQGAVWGAKPFDLANLLEDARRCIDPALRTKMLDRYCSDMSEQQAALMRQWYRVLATQFHCRVIGQFIKLAVLNDKDRYLKHIPRLQAYLLEGLKDPILAPLSDWFKEQKIDFMQPFLFDRTHCQEWLSLEAF